ncbi:ubiquinone biosynthesis protein [Ruminiclostridium sufflavum DSM 19573]|uniref:Ubiquinone biosynthesis protein n=1 Tax=Ruminiclostridium sufflavum DSM 19573 TaxID=1121337 RepID=A0A318XN63_9FIRM|nr:AarF/UbiB family protein [Ruminiclostridium sufflavum]PYG88231.1 ubiquinone biosynthesis protein [Ruminiclostridium sufflavum DSM 19573]
MERQESSTDSSKKRLGQIILVLVKNEVVKGITPEKLRKIIEELGPTFIKLGQVMSMRNEILPAEYCKELEKLRADVRPMDFAEVKKVIEEEYGTELEEIFESFESTPLGSASIAQAHFAILKNGDRVVVKVQRPGIKDIMARDISLLRKASKILKIAVNTGNVVDFGMILDEMWTVTSQEMDFLIEARHAEEFYDYNRDIVYSTCPKIEHKYTTSKVLVMEYIDGIQIDETDSLISMGYDLNEIGLKLAENYIKQIIDDAFFHADPHPGNIRIREGEIVWIDLGMMGRLSNRDKLLFKNAVGAIAENNTEEIKNILITLGNHKGRINHVRLYSDISDMLSKYGSMNIGDMNLGSIIEEFIVLANTHGISMPKGMSMLSRGIITIEGVLSKLSPDINIVQVMANRMSSEVMKDIDLSKELLNTGKTLYGSARKTLEIPAQLSDILKMTIKGQTKVNLELTGSEEPLTAIDKMVNKLVICIINAGLLIGSSLICTTDMELKLLGLPLIGVLGYAVAIILGGWLIFDIRKRKP